MPLSEYEQRVLDELAEQLRSDDPKLAETISGRASRKPLFVGLGIVGLLGGLTALVIGSATSQLWLSAIGFVVMFGGVLLAISRPKGEANDGADASGGSNVRPIGSAKRPAETSSFMRKLEERWERRRREP